MEKKRTISDYMKLEEGAPYQLIKGAMVCEPSPTYYHQSTSAKIFYQIQRSIEQCRKGVALYSPMDVILDEHNVVQPDILYLAEENKKIIHDGRIYGVPDLLVEILSPFNSKQDTEDKKEIYEKFGVKEYWLVNPEDNSVMGFENSTNGFVEIFKGKNSFFSKLLDLKIML